MVITDFGILKPDTRTKELARTQLHPGATVEAAIGATGWALRVSPDLMTAAEPGAEELASLRRLEQRSREAHGDRGARTS